jgi:hypothetical protein
VLAQHASQNKANPVDEKTKNTNTKNIPTIKTTTINEQSKTTKYKTSDENHKLENK